MAVAHRLAFRLALSAACLASCSCLTVCVVEDTAMTMRRAGFSAASITSDDQLRGFEVEVRKRVLANYNYTVRMVGSYGGLHALIRSPTTECDVAWAMFYQYGFRETCDMSSATCKALDAPATAALAQLELGIADAAPAGGWTPYRCCIDFSFAYVSLDIGVMYLDGAAGKSFFEVVFQIIFEPFVANYLSFLFLWIVIFGHIIWLSERKHNEEFPMRYCDGIDDAVWWATVTVTTVGYGDKSPRTPLGRIAAMVWMILGLFIFSVLAGHMSGRFVELAASSGSITSAHDLSGLRVCSYFGTFGAWYFPDSIEMTQVEANNIVECSALMAAGGVDAIVMDMAFMAYHSKNDPWARSSAELKFSPPIASVPSGVLFPETADGRALNEEISAKLMSFRDSLDFINLQEEWLAPPANVPSSMTKVQWEMVLPTLIILGLYASVQLNQLPGRAGVCRLGNRQTAPDPSSTMSHSSSLGTVAPAMASPRPGPIDSLGKSVRVDPF
jgi:ABC-type amino acid transport substrate-binding protein